MKNYSNKFCSWSVLLLLFSGLAFASCSDDDDDNGGGSKITCFAEVDGQKVDFKYAYYAGEGVYNVLDVCTIDMMYYYKNPGKIKKGIVFSEAVLQWRDQNGATTNDYDFEIDLNYDLYDLVNDTYDGEMHGENYNWYCVDWTQKQTPISVTKDGTYFKIEAFAVKLLAADEDDGIGDDNRKTTGNFYFDGTAAEYPDDMIEDSDAKTTRGIKVVKVDMDFMNWLKSLKR